MKEYKYVYMYFGIQYEKILYNGYFLWLKMFAIWSGNGCNLYFVFLTSVVTIYLYAFNVHIYIYKNFVFAIFANFCKMVNRRQYPSYSMLVRNVSTEFVLALIKEKNYQLRLHTSQPALLCVVTSWNWLRSALSCCL
jgi:hypothetical protein